MGELKSITDIENYARGCEKCGLWQTRANVVVGRGNTGARLMLVGEAPGEQENKVGLPFVGQAGKLLDALLHSLSLDENDYYITNVVKCRPPGNRAPNDDEAIKCLPFLRGQYKIIQPWITVCMGATASKYLIDRNIRITRDRGIWVTKKGYLFMPTFHPAALLRDVSKKIDFYNDMKQVVLRYKELRLKNGILKGQ